MNAIHTVNGEFGQIQFLAQGWTRSPKQTVAYIQYSLKVSKTTSIAGTVYFKTNEDARASYEANNNNPHIIMSEVRINNQIIPEVSR